MSARDMDLDQLRYWLTVQAGTSSVAHPDGIEEAFDAYDAKLCAAALRVAADVAGHYAEVDFTAGHVEITLRRMAEEGQ